MSSSTTGINHSRNSIVSDKDKINFIAAIFHHIDVVFSIIAVVLFFRHDQLDLAGVALTLVLLDRIGQFLVSGVKTYKWSKALMSLVYLDYLIDLRSPQEGRGMRLFQKKYAHVLLISSPFAVLCFFGYFELPTHHGLLLACGFIHAANTIQSNLEFYTQNIVTITLKQRIYIYIFSFCEFFYRLVFLSYFKQLIGKGGISGYLTGMFFVNMFCEFIACKRENQEKAYWVGAILQKGWCGVFYFRLEDIMVQDVDEWNEDNRNQDNHRQTTRLHKEFKSARSKMFITLRLLENLLLTITGIAQFADDSSNVALFVLAIILLPFYLFWHVKYARFNFADAQQNVNRMGIEGNNDLIIADKYKINNNLEDKNINQNEDIEKLSEIELPKQQKRQEQLNQNKAIGGFKKDTDNDGIATYDTHSKPMQTPLKVSNNENRYTGENDVDVQQVTEQTHIGNSDSKKLNSQRKSLANSENTKQVHSRQYSGAYSKSKKAANNNSGNNFNANLQQEENGLERNGKGKQVAVLGGNNNLKQSYQDDDDDEQDQSYGKSNVNAFVIE